MTARIVVSCDADWLDMPCRGAYPARDYDYGDGVGEAERHGWRREAVPGGWRDLCPAHARALSTAVDAPGESGNPAG
jgi:hypothetical protein